MDALIPRRGIPSFEPSYPKDGLIAEYLFNDNLSDTSLCGYDLTLTGSMSYVSTGLSGLPKGGTFSSSAVARNNTFTLPANTEFTISCWAKATTSNTTVIVDVQKNESPWRPVIYLAITNSSIIYTCLNTNQSSWYELTGSSANTSWTHIVMTQSSNQAKMYRNGSLLTTGSYSYLTSQVVRLNIGNADSQSTTAERSLSGVRLYNRVLTAEEISQLYNNGNGR